ncbi:MAG: iron-containing alcohol dehydrogenase [Eubacteriales bacterium]|nr:iron-containing alcohol dehydrogenase [Eubacteriales bacterium]
MANVSIFPGKYVQGRKALEQIGEHLAAFGTRYLALVNPTIGQACMDQVTSALRRGLREEQLVLAEGGVECCMREIRRVEALISENHCDAVIGVGGGKTLDTAKAAAYYAGVPVAIVPTAASSDAPCSALAVIYTEQVCRCQLKMHKKRQTCKKALANSCGTAQDFPFGTCKL